MTRSIDLAIDMLSKSEATLPPSKRRVLNRHKKLVSSFVKGFELDAKEATKEILDIASKFMPKK